MRKQNAKSKVSILLPQNDCATTTKSLVWATMDSIQVRVTLIVILKVLHTLEANTSFTVFAVDIVTSVHFFYSHAAPGTQLPENFICCKPQGRRLVHFVLAFPQSAGVSKVVRRNLAVIANARVAKVTDCFFAFKLFFADEVNGGAIGCRTASHWAGIALLSHKQG